jgi:hypothetical protein
VDRSDFDKEIVYPEQIAYLDVRVMDGNRGNNLHFEKLCEVQFSSSVTKIYALKKSGMECVWY